jgi:hypothetical protein
MIEPIIPIISGKDKKKKIWHLWKVEYKTAFDLDCPGESGYYAIFVSEEGDTKRVKIKIGNKYG